MHCTPPALYDRLHCTEQTLLLQNDCESAGNWNSRNVCVLLLPLPLPGISEISCRVSSLCWHYGLVAWPWPLSVLEISIIAY